MRQRLEEHLRRKEDLYFELLRHMVGINSFTANQDGVHDLAELTAYSFAQLGFAAESVPSEFPEFGDHLVLSRPAASGGAAPRIALVSHLDTVFPPEEEKRHDFVWRPDGDRLYGPGTVDIKGGTVVAYMMLDALKAVAPEVYGSVEWAVLLNSSEERFSPDFGKLCLDRLDDGRTLAGLVFEGGYVDSEECNVVVARKGMAVYGVTVEGRASHSGSGHAHGANAVVQMAEVIRRIAAMTDHDRDLTFNVGSVRGGTVANRVPHQAEAEVEMRAFAKEVFDEGLAAALALDGFSSVASVADAYPCRVRVEVTSTTPPWPRNEGTDRLFGIWKEEATALGLRAVPEERGGLSDGNQFWQRIPSLDGLGPSGGNAHCSQARADGSKGQEYATRSSFVPKTLLNTFAVLRLIEEAGTRLSG